MLLALRKDDVKTWKTSVALKKKKFLLSLDECFEGKMSRDQVKR